MDNSYRLLDLIVHRRQEACVDSPNGWLEYQNFYP
jgi:hypothetical protein